MAKHSKRAAKRSEKHKESGQRAKGSQKRNPTGDLGWDSYLSADRLQNRPWSEPTPLGVLKTTVGPDRTWSTLVGPGRPQAHADGTLVRAYTYAPQGAHQLPRLGS